MNSVTQTMQFRQSLLKYAEKHGVTKAAIKYNVNRQYVYRWKRRYTGDIQSLANRSHRPHHHPNQHTEAELHKITSFRRRNPNIGLVVLWVKLRKSGYKRSITGLYRVLRRQGQMPEKLPNPKCIPKPYEQMHFPGERVQIDVKFVPEVCIVGDAKGEKFYQYTAIDEFSRWRYLEAFQKARLKASVDARYQDKAAATGSIMLCELQGATEEFIFRWNVVFQEHPEILIDKVCQKKLSELMDRRMSYLKTVKEEKL